MGEKASKASLIDVGFSTFWSTRTLGFVFSVLTFWLLVLYTIILTQRSASCAWLPLMADRAQMLHSRSDHLDDDTNEGHRRGEISRELQIRSDTLETREFIH